MKGGEEKDSILNLMDPDVENDAQAFEQRQSNLKILRNTNKFFGLVFFALTIIFTIDFFLTESETYEIPSSCISSGSCTIDARTPTKRGPNYVYLEFFKFNQNYRDYMLSMSQSQLYSDEPKLENIVSCGSFTDTTPCGLIVKSYPKITMKVDSSSGSSINIFPYKTSSLYTNDLFTSEKTSDLKIKGNHYLANWMNLGLTSNFRKFYGVIKEEIPNRKIKVHLSIGSKNMADATGLANLVIIDPWLIGQKYPTCIFLNLIICVSCLLFYQKAAKKLDFEILNDL